MIDEYAALGGIVAAREGGVVFYIEEAEPRPRLFITHSGDHLKPAFTSLREHDRTVMLFSMKDGDKEICCAVSSSAMDDLERGAKAKPDQHDDQFLRLRERIKQRAV